MKVLILYRPDSEHDTMVQGFLRDYRQRTGKDIELMSLDTREGSDMAELYGAIDYPVILAIEENGSLQKMWEGTELPLMDEVSYYDRSE